MRALVFGDHIRLLDDIYTGGHTYRAGLRCVVVWSVPGHELFVHLQDGCDAAMVSPEYVEYEIIEEQTQ